MTHIQYQTIKSQLTVFSVLRASILKMTHQQVQSGWDFSIYKGPVFENDPHSQNDSRDKNNKNSGRN